MEPISNADRLVLLLRQKLEEQARARAGKSSIRRSDASPTEGPIGVQGLAAMEGADERQLRRAFVQTLLADQLGSGLVNDAQFQQIVTRVVEAIEEDNGTAALLTRLVAELRQS